MVLYKVNLLIRIVCILALVVLTITDFYKEWFCAVIYNTRILGKIPDIKAGDILRVGILGDGYLGSFWGGESPVSHYVIVLSVDSKLQIVHMCPKRISHSSVTNIKPHYCIQSLDAYIQYSGMKFCTRFRNNKMIHKDHSKDRILEILNNHQLNQRCYMVIGYLIEELYPELGCIFEPNKDKLYYLEYFYLPMQFESKLTTQGFEGLSKGNTIYTF